ncbi:PRTRC system protein C [Chitinophaga barathri]|uniref:PRTRC system protein C n=1 Tax=Chitinophaga barathri TaxID=1647451 RepID=A0A3N4MGI1_9BACT|nr:PRTRC system protein C [Chitinophaga barathri]RPD43074.1 PRTRC system protein C [Chitinophaga barathri]
MIEVKTLPRLFVTYLSNSTTETVLADPGEHLTPAMVCMHYAPMYPLLASATPDGPKLEPRGRVYYIKPIVGTKG